MQAEEGESLAAQVARLHEWAKANGYVVVAEYQDAGASARALDRPEFVRMLQDARKTPRPFDAVLVWKWDRFARNVDDATIYKGLLRRQLGVDLIAVGDPQAVGATGMLLERILDVVAEFQSLVTAEHVRNTMGYLAREGRWLGRVPFGYRLGENGRLEPDEEEAPAVRWAFEQVARGKASLGEVTAVFQAGLRFPATRGAKGIRWSQQAVRKMLENEVYLGRVVWNRRETVVVTRPDGRSHKAVRWRGKDEWIETAQTHEALVDEPTFRRVGEVLRRNSAWRASRTPYGDYLFRGLVKCGRCGKTLVWYAPKGSSRPKLVCSGYFRVPGAACRPMVSIRPEELKAAVVAAGAAVLEGTGEPEVEVVGARETDGAERALEALKRREERLFEAYEAGAITLEEFRARKRVLDGERASLEAELGREGKDGETREEAVRRLREGLRSVLERIDDEGLSVGQRNAMLARWISRVVVGPEKRLRIVWRAELG